MTPGRFPHSSKPRTIPSFSPRCHACPAVDFSPTALPTVATLKKNPLFFKKDALEVLSFETFESYPGDPPTENCGLEGSEMLLLLELRCQESDQIRMSSLGSQQGLPGRRSGWVSGAGSMRTPTAGFLLSFPSCSQAKGWARDPGQPAWSPLPWTQG